MNLSILSNTYGLLAFCLFSKMLCFNNLQIYPDGNDWGDDTNFLYKPMMCHRGEVGVEGTGEPWSEENITQVSLFSQVSSL